MPTILLKRGPKTAVDIAALEPGELAVATDTGDVFVGKKDGNKSKLVKDEDIESSVFASDSDLTNPVEVDTSSIGPVQLLADKISFTDGETFQAKYESGELKGPMGASGVAGEKGDTGPAGLPGPVGMPEFDLIIRTQEDFDTMLASPTWLDAKNVAFLAPEAGTIFTKTDGALRIPITVKRIKGFNNPSIEILNFNFTEGSAAFGYDITKTLDGAEYSIENITLNVRTSSTGSCVVGFQNLKNMINCHCTCMNETGVADEAFPNRCFYKCEDLTNCQGIDHTMAGFKYIFSECNNLFNCTGNIIGGIRGGKFVFYDCDNLISCKGDAIPQVGEDGASVFANCNKLVNCLGDATAQVAICALYTFSHCTNLVNCLGIAYGAGTNELYIRAFDNCDLLTNCGGDGKCNGISGYETEGLGCFGFYDCSYMNGCRQRSYNGSTTDLLGGSNTKVDTLTVMYMPS